MKVLKEQLACAISKQLELLAIIYYLNYDTTEEQKYIDVLSLKQNCICCYVVLSNVFYFFSLELCGRLNPLSVEEAIHQQCPFVLNTVS